MSSVSVTAENAIVDPSGEAAAPTSTPARRSGAEAGVELSALQKKAASRCLASFPDVSLLS